MLRTGLPALLLVLLTGCATTPASAPIAPACDGLPAHAAGAERASLWLRHASEYRANAEIVYGAALAALQRGLADPDWIAEPAQQGASAGLPPAVVLDIDETVLDNSTAEVRMLQAGTCTQDFQALWDAWLAERAATAVPGALEFVRAARSLRDPAGQPVRVVFITNRECALRPGNADPCPQKADTAANLRALGYDAPGLEADLMLKGERPGWTSEKASRRAAIAATHRIVLNIGDDLRDFIAGIQQAGPAEREAARCRHAGWWGRRWFALPNPMYGSWHRALGTDPVAALAAEPLPAACGTED